MRILIQRVTSAVLTIEQQTHSAINHGMVILVGIEHADDQHDADYLAAKVASLRIFDDQQGVMNLSVDQVGGSVMVVSQFTLHAATNKGNRPSYINAARPEQAIPLYQYFIDKLNSLLQKPVQTGVFGANMRIALENDGPVTIWIDSKNKQ